MMYPLVGDLAGDGVPVAVTCRVLKISRQPRQMAAWLADFAGGRGIRGSAFRSRTRTPTQTTTADKANHKQGDTGVRLAPVRDGRRRGRCDREVWVSR
jgi:hypothetical protein